MSTCDESLIGISSNSELKAEIEKCIEEIFTGNEAFAFRERVCLDFKRVHLESIVSHWSISADELDRGLRKCTLNRLQQYLYEILTDFTMEVRSCIIILNRPHIIYDFLEKPAGRWMVEQVSNAYLHYNLNLYEAYVGEIVDQILDKDSLETCIYDLLGEFVQELVDDKKGKMEGMIFCFDYCFRNR